MPKPVTVPAPDTSLFYGLAAAFARTMLEPGAVRPMPVSIGYTGRGRRKSAVLTFADGSAVAYPV